MTKHKSSLSVSRLAISIIAALAILALVMVLLARSSSTQNGTEVVASVPPHDVAALEAATSKPTSVPSPTIAAKELETNTPSPVPEYIVPKEASTPDYAEAFYATAVAIAQTLDTVTPIPGIPPEKQGLSQERMQRAVATTLILFPVPTGYVPPRATGPAWPPTPVIVDRPAGAGLMIDDLNEGSSMHFLQRVNGWHEEKNNTTIVVYAGRSFDEVSPRQGEVFVEIDDPKTHEVIEKPILYPSPSRHGELRITDVVGERLTLTAEDNTQFYFDVPTRIWGSP